MDKTFGKFSDISYERPDIEAFKTRKRQYIYDFANASSYEESKKLFLQDDEDTAALASAYQVAYIRMTCDTRDEYYQKEVEYLDEQFTYISLLEKEAAENLISCPFKRDFALEFGEDVIKRAEAQIRLSDESVIDEQIEENKLCQEYSNVTAACKTKFMGEECNFYGLLKYMENPDREIRKKAFIEWAKLYEGVSGKLNDIFIQLVSLRRSMAKKLGFENYGEMAYLKNSHFYYGAKDVATFREQVVKFVVPVAERLYNKQEKTLGIDRMMYYDEEIKYAEGNAHPEGDEKKLLNAAREMYTDMSKETGEFFSFMQEHELFDLTTRPGKHLGGYCTFIDNVKAPFIFSNFNGTGQDVDTLTHETGHAFQAYVASRTHPLSAQVWSTNEISEIHSMTMELFSYPYMEKFCGKGADKYIRAHFEGAIESIPYLCLVDHFQHKVYEEENLTGEKLAAIWKELEAIYMPWRRYDGYDFLERGGFWMQKQHIFLYPFYYIDYALAQIAAFELYNRYTDDKEDAWQDYFKLCKAGGSMPYFELLKYAHLSNPFDYTTVQRVMGGVKNKLKNGIYKKA